MPTTIKKVRRTVVHVVHEPGNMTRYEVYAVPCQDREWTWLVTVVGYGYMKVPVGSAIHYGYVAEKLKCNHIDGSEIAKVIAQIVPDCEADVCTSEYGMRSRPM